MNKVVIVTGASRGIGAATAKLLGSQNYSVCVNYHVNAEQAEEVVATINSHGGRAFSCQADVSSENEVKRLFDKAQEMYGEVNYLVNNAGILFKQSSMVQIDLERFNKVIMTNLMSCFLCSKEAVSRMKNGGAIVNVSSIASKTGSPNEYIDYAASKGAIDSFTKGLALEVAERGIRVNAVRPGFIFTDMHSDGGEPDRVKRLSPQIPLKRGGSAEEVAKTIAWLLSEESAYITGGLIDVAGGK